MEAVTRLLARAWLAHLTVQLDGDYLQITGPMAASVIVQELARRKADVVAHLSAQACGPLHLQPGIWVHRDGRAYCPGCDKFMGYVRGGQ